MIELPITLENLFESMKNEAAFVHDELKDSNEIVDVPPAIKWSEDEWTVLNFYFLELEEYYNVKPEYTDDAIFLFAQTFSGSEISNELKKFSRLVSLDVEDNNFTLIFDIEDEDVFFEGMQRASDAAVANQKQICDECEHNKGCPECEKFEKGLNNMN